MIMPFSCPVRNRLSKYIKNNPIHLRHLLLILLLAWVAALYPKRINLVASDLGRHIKNGEIVFKQGKIISTNYYSYTVPDYPFPTHHWGIGVIYYVIWKTTGFKGLSVFNTLCILMSLFFFYRSAEKLSNYKYAFLFSLLIIPLLLFRVEVRPENVSYLFAGAVFFLLVRYHLKEITFKRLLTAMVIIQVLWVNIHIFFIFSLLFTGIFWFQHLVTRQSVKHYSILLGALILASMVSPFHVKAFLEPFTIMHNFEMKISENLPVPLTENGHLFRNLYFFYFKLVFLISLISFVFVILKRNLLSQSAYPLLFLFIGILSWKMNRFIALFGLVMIPVLAHNHRIIIENYKTTVHTVFYCMIWYGIINFSLIQSRSVLAKTGLGLEDERVNNAAYFFKNKGLKGPVLNNMNIGSYLIFHLFPQEKVFFDARPEAYPATFISDVYRPVFQRPEKWREGLAKYRFNVIFFYKRVMTDYEKSFLEERLSDPQWAVVFNDDYSIILIRK